jgi:hypothetical protein
MIAILTMVADLMRRSPPESGYRLPGATSAEQLATALWEVLEKPAPGSAADATRTALEDVSRFEQIEEALERAFSASRSRFLDSGVTVQIATRIREIAKIPREEALTLEVGVQIRSIMIPDASKDEIVLDLRFVSGVALDTLFDFLCALHSDDHPTLQAFRSSQRKWSRADIQIGLDAGDRELLERCLGVEVQERLEKTDKLILYNYGPKTRKLWRTCDQVVRVRAAFHLRDYPTDESLISLHLTAPGYLDAGECQLLPDITLVGTGLDMQSTAPPRGFRIVWRTGLEAIGRSPSQDQQLENVLRLAWVLRRDGSTSLWRTFVPTAMVLLLATVATGCAIVTSTFTESVMTQVLPGVLIAAVGLQLAAAQLIPVRSGLTRLDEVFIASYAYLVLLYVSLGVGPGVARWITLPVAAIIGGVAAWRYFTSTPATAP